MTQSCEVCGGPASWYSSTPDAAGKSNVRRQGFLCAVHGEAWSDFFFQRRQTTLYRNKEGINPLMWQECFDDFVSQTKEQQP